MSKNKNRNQNNQNTEVENKEVVVDQPSTEEELENAKIGMPEKVDEKTEAVDDPVDEVPVQEEPVVDEHQEVVEAAEEVHEEEVVEEDDATTRGYYVRLNIRCNLIDKMNTILASIGAKKVSMYDFDFVSGPYKTNEEAQEVSKKIIAKGIRVIGIAECTE